MKLNASILAHELSDLNPRLCGEPGMELTLSDIRLLSNQTPLSAEHLYLCTWESLRRQSDTPGTAVCIGGGDEACGFLEKRGISGLVLEGDVDIIMVLERMQDVFLHFNNLEHELMDAVLGEESLGALLNICAKFFKNPVFVVDAPMSLIAFSDNYPHTKATKAWRETFSKRMVSPMIMNELKRRGLTSMLNRSTEAVFLDLGPEYMRGMSANLFEEDIRVASLGIIEVNAPMSPLQVGLADFIALLLSREILKRHGTVSHSHTLLRDCMEKMLLGQRPDEGIVASHLSRLGWKLDDDYLLLRILLPQHAIADGTAEHSKRVYESIFDACIALEMNETLVIPLRLKGSEGAPAEGITLLQGYLEKDGAICGTSLPFCDFMLLRKQYLLVGAAIDLGSPENSIRRYGRDYPTVIPAQEECIMRECDKIYESITDHLCERIGFSRLKTSLPSSRAAAINLFPSWSISRISSRV